MSDYVHFRKGEPVDIDGCRASVAVTCHQSAKVHVRFDDNGLFDYVPYHLVQRVCPHCGHRPDVGYADVECTCPQCGESVLVKPKDRDHDRSN